MMVGEAYLTAYVSFSPKYTSASSNLRETTAVLNELLYFRQVLLGGLVKGLSVGTDNMVTVLNLQGHGASQSLLYKTRQIFSLLQKMDVRLMVMHIPGVENEVADVPSCMDRVGDYRQQQEYLRWGAEARGVKPTVDVFANSTNHKCKRFLALPGRLAEGAVALDGLRFTWAGELAYVFPPVQLLPRVLQKMRLERDTVVMVVPQWPSRPWWNMLAGRAKRMVRLGKSEDVLEKERSMAAN
jgi:hypothetical protein